MTYSTFGTTTITRDFIPEGVVSILSFELASFIYIDAITDEWQSWYDGTNYLENGKLYGFIVSVNSEPVEWQLLNDLMDEPAGRLIYNGISKIKEELGKGIGDCDLTNIKYYNKPKSIWELFGFEEEDLEQIGTPNNPRYWKNIIPKDYSIFNREGLDGKYIDTYSEQEWLDGYYYPVLPKYNQNGEFTENDFPNDNIPFPSKGSITNEIERDENLLINMGNTKIESDVLNDNSGNKNYSFLIQDFSPKFDDETLRVEKTKQRSIFKISKRNGAF